VNHVTLSVHTAVAPFNTDFYAAAATVIPVLFLALSLQSGTWRQLRVWAGSDPDEIRARINEIRRSGTRVPSSLRIRRVSVMLLNVSLLLIDLAAAAAEISAFIALENQQATYDERRLVMFAVAFLTAATLLITVLGYAWESGRRSANRVLKTQTTPATESDKQHALSQQSCLRSRRICNDALVVVLALIWLFGRKRRRH
jgi:hypothetical protein